MYEILKKEKLSSNIYRMVVHAPNVAENALPGQFLIVRIDNEGERIPLTICDYDTEKGTVDIVFQPAGAESYRMSLMEEGGCFHDVVGPLGCASELTKKDPEELKKMKILYVAGGVGTAPVYPQLKWLKEHGVLADAVEGAKSKDIVIMEDEMKSVAGELFVTTDDGSYGRSGMVTKVIQDLYDEGRRYDLCVAIGPMIMMKFVVKLTKQLGLPTVVSMNPIMVDGTGMCGACRILVDGKVKFACVDGPEFDGFKVDFDQAMQRSRMYKTWEGQRYLEAKEGATHSGGCGNCN
jgi:ferredoxin--NADP+ reductase